MIFSSQLFLLVFLPTFIVIYYIVPSNIKAKNVVALIASVLFFSWGEPVNVFVLILSTLVHYVTASKVITNKKCQDSIKRYSVIILIALDIGLLINFKYLDFIRHIFWSDINSHEQIAQRSIMSFLGISFITFHQISFLVDLYVGRCKLPRLLDYALYIFLFPQLIAGPIIRYHDIGEQFVHRDHNVHKFLHGMLIFSIGLTKKIIVADPLGLMADSVFSLPLVCTVPDISTGKSC